MNPKKILYFVPNIIFFLAGSLIVLVLSYRFGWVLLQGGLNWGNDLPAALSYVFYLDRWWPYLPLWHYEWAGGMPFSQNYPILATYLTLFIHQISNFSIVQVARFFYWASIPLSGIGIMIFTRLVLKNWLMAILAAVFYVLSPDSWLWITQGGFYAMTISFPIMVATFILFELAIQKRKRIFWILTIIFNALTWLAHPMTGFIQLLGLSTYGLIQGLEEKKLIKGVLRSILVSIVGLLLVAFWTIPFFSFKSGHLGISVNQIVFLTIKEFLGLAPAHDIVYVTSTFFNGSLLVLAALGILFALIKRNYTYWKLISTAFLGIFLLIVPKYIPWVVSDFSVPFWVAINVRVAVLPRLFLPMIAAFGVVSLSQVFFLGNNLLWRLSRQVIGGAIALGIVLLVFRYIVIVPPAFEKVFYPGYGPAFGWIPVNKVNGQRIIVGPNKPLVPSIIESLQKVLTWNIEVSDTPVHHEGIFLSGLAEKLGLTTSDRVDFSPPAGALSGAWNTATGVSQIPSYIQTSLIQPWIGYQLGCFYNVDILCNKEEVQNLAKWFGVKLVYVGYLAEEGGVVGVDEKLLTNLKLADFRSGVVEVENKTKIVFYEIPEASGLASLSNKPLVLAIGGSPSENGGFVTLFRSLNRINFSYERMILIQGKRFIDDYTLDELKSYPLIILYGYRTHNKNKAWRMLSEYVKNGGNLFVDTGWQYFSEDWGIISGDGESLEVDLPGLLPIAKSKWGDIGRKWIDLKIDNSFLAKKAPDQNWGELSWDGKPWGMAMAEPGNLREFGKALVTASGKVIIASGTVGKGKVVWSGMNIFAHTNSYQSEAENEFFLDLFSWLTEGTTNNEEQLSFERINPDYLVIKIDKTVVGEREVMFKESMAPGWRAWLEVEGRKKEVPILKAGPGWKLIALPSDFSIGSLILNYQRTFGDRLFILVSVVTALGIIIYGIKGDLFATILNRFTLTLKIKTFLANKFSSLKKGWKENEEV